MNIKRLLATFVVTCCTFAGFHTVYAADQLVQVTKESQLVSGRAYKLYYVSNSTGCYVKAEDNRFSVQDGATYDGDDADYYFISDGNGKWKIQSKTKQTYFPEPTGEETFSPTDNAESAGHWTLNFLEGKSGIFAPYSGNYCLDRSNSVLHSNTKDSRFPRDVNQFKIYEWVGTFNADGKVYTLKGASDWMLIPTGGIYYYLYNTSSSMFAYPSSSGSWETKNNVAVPLRVVKQNENTYQLSTKDGTKTFTWNSQTDFEIEESAGSIPDVYTYLLGQTAVTDVSSDITDGWFALRISDDNDHPEFDGNFLYTLETPYGMGTIEYPYPVGHGGTYDQHPAKDDATYYFRLFAVDRNGTTYYHWQLPNGIYIVNYLNNFARGEVFS